MKYQVNLSFERMQSIEVEADSAEEAREIVANGEFEDSQIVDTEDDYVEITSVIPLNE
jgi:hypothetical protein